MRESRLPGFQKERPETRAALWARAELRQRAPLPGEQGVRAGGSRGCVGLGRGSSPGLPRRSRCGGRVSLHSAQTGGEPGTPLSLRRKTAGGGDLRARVPRGTRPSAPRPARQAAPSVSGSSGSALCGRCPRPAAAEGDRSGGAVVSPRDSARLHTRWVRLGLGMRQRPGTHERGLPRSRGQLSVGWGGEKTWRSRTRRLVCLHRPDPCLPCWRILTASLALTRTRVWGPTLP